jgi:hypothetical protein
VYNSRDYTYTKEEKIVIIKNIIITVKGTKMIKFYIHKGCVGQYGK